MEVVVLLIVLCGLVPVIYRSVTKSKWGINFSPPKSCPECSTALPRGPRRPADAHEMMWGGWTCSNCGAKIDKFGSLRQL